MIRQEDRFRSFDGSEIYFQLWQVPRARGLIIITHGLAEHSECYAAIVKRWNLDDWDVLAWDLRGHGQSAGQRGYIENFSDYTRDMHQLLVYLQSGLSIAPRSLVLFGHSMGGLITYSAALQYPNWNVSAVALSSPLFGISVQVPWWKESASGLLAKYAPRLTLNNEVDFNFLTHDQDLIKSYHQDPLRHEKISPSLYVALQKQMAWVRDNVTNWKIPVLFQLAGDDRLVSTPTSLQLYEKLPIQDKRIQVYDGLYHEIYNEIGKENVDNDLRQFLASHSRSP